MKTIVLSLLAGAAAATAQADFKAWRMEQAVPVPAAGLVRLDLPPDTLDVGQASLADLRVLSPEGQETPWMTDTPKASQAREMAAADFKATLAGQTTVLTATVPTRDPVEAITLDSPAPDFLKLANIEASEDGANWKSVAAGEIVFRQNGASRLRVPVPPAAYAKLRVTLDDRRAAPVPIAGLRFRTVQSVARTIPHTARVAGREEHAGESVVRIELGQKNLPLASLSLDVADALFSRPCSLAYRALSGDGTEHDIPLSGGVLYRVTAEGGTSVADTEIPIGRPVPSATLVLTIRNGGSPPLEIRAASARRLPADLVFFAKVPGEWKLLSGNRQARPPDYDLGAARMAFGKGEGSVLAPGPLRPRPEYVEPAALPMVAAVGAPIDLSGWGYRRPVAFPDIGVVKIEIEAGTLARCQDDLGDLRLVQDGKQVPYLVASRSISRAIRPVVAEYPDAKRPAVSRWKLTMPMAGLPARELTATSPTGLFTRTFVARVEREDSLGNPWIETLGTARWTKAPASGEGASLSLGLASARLPATFLLETDNGDNPPVALENVAVRHAVPVIAAKLASAAPLFLYYGKPDVGTPRYDLGLVRNELLEEGKLAGVPGAEEALGPDRARPAGTSGTGSPWLWLAMGLVVVVLLVVVAKLLPSKPDAKP